jgi:hypothetical protein
MKWAVTQECNKLNKWSSRWLQVSTWEGLCDFEIFTYRILYMKNIYFLFYFKISIYQFLFFQTRTRKRPKRPRPRVRRMESRARSSYPTPSLSSSSSPPSSARGSPSTAWKVSLSLRGRKSGQICSQLTHDRKVVGSNHIQILKVTGCKVIPGSIYLSNLSSYNNKKNIGSQMGTPKNIINK